MAVVPFLKSETGAVTVDWVVLTAGAVSLCLALIGALSVGAHSASDAMVVELEAPIETSFGDRYVAFDRAAYDDRYNAFMEKADGGYARTDAALVTGHADTVASARAAIADGDRDAASRHIDQAAASEAAALARDVDLSGNDGSSADLLTSYDAAFAES